MKHPPLGDYPLTTREISFGPLEKFVSCPNLHLTNFFDLSNIRAFAGGPVKMFGASRCLQKMPFQFDGRPALGADLPFGCGFSTPFSCSYKNISQHRLAGLPLRSFLLTEQGYRQGIK